MHMAKPIAKLLSIMTPKRRWAQFSLATMLLVVTVLCVSLSVVVNWAHRQRDAVAAIQAFGGGAKYAEPDDEASEAFPKPFLRRWLPLDYFDKVREVYLYRTQVTDAGLAQLQSLTELEELDLRGTQVTGAGLAHLQGLTRLQVLFVTGIQFKDAELVHLQRLANLQWLSLDRTQVTDAGLAHLHVLHGLRVLFLNGTHVTDAGLAQLRQALPNRQIYGP